MGISHDKSLTITLHYGVSVAKWLDYSPFTCKVDCRGFESQQCSRTQSSRAQVNALRKVVGFLRVLRFPPTGKVDRVG